MVTWQIRSGRLSVVEKHQLYLHLPFPTVKEKTSYLNTYIMVFVKFHTISLLYDS